MTNVEMILKLMEPELDTIQLAKLKNVLDTILRTSRNVLPNEELIERFKQQKSLVGLKPSSLNGYVTEVRAMARYYNDKSYCDITTADMKDYLAYMVKARNLQAATLQTKIRAISSFFEFLYSTGTRLAEVIALNVKDINFSEGEVIVFGKGHKERVVYLSNICMKYLQEYLEERYAQPDEPLFTHLTNGHRLTPRAAELILKDIGDRAGVENVHPHRFRRTCATHLMDRGMPVEQIREVLGHAKLETTMIYCNVNSSKVKASFKEAFNRDTYFNDVNI